jgi:uncharacterized protein (TIGR03435 family)
MLCQQQTMQDSARALGRMLKSTVTDATGLIGKYGSTVAYASEWAGHIFSFAREFERRLNLVVQTLYA